LSTPAVYAARQGLEPEIVEAFRSSIAGIQASDWPIGPSMKDTFDHEKSVTAIVEFDDSYFNDLREALRKAARFDGEVEATP